MTIVTSIQILERLFIEFNNHFFNGELETPVIHYYPDEKKKTYGHMSREKVWSTTDKAQRAYELNICCNTVRGEQCYKTLLHEMVHLYANMHGIQDCSNNSHYHNKKFKELCSKFGLIATKIEYSNYGFGHTEFTEESKTWVDNLVKKELPDILRLEDSDLEPTEETEGPEEVKIRKPRVQRTFKYICPGCKTLIKSRDDSLEIHCNSCDMDFEKVLPRTVQNNYHMGENDEEN